MATIAVRSPEEKKLVETQTKLRREQFASTMSRYVTWAIGIFAISAAAQWVFDQQYIQFLFFAAFSAFPLVGAQLYPFFRRRGRVKMGTFILLFSLLTLALALPVLVPEELLTSLLGYLLIVILGNLLLDAKENWLIIGACFLALAVDIVVVKIADINWFPPLPESNSLITTLLATAAFLMTAIIVRRVILGQEEYFQRSLLANSEIERRAAAEREQSEYLRAKVQEYAEFMAEVGRGNLVLRLSLAGKEQRKDDPLLALGDQLNETVVNLQSMITKIRDAASDLSSAAAEILASTTQQAMGANEQSAAISQTTATVEEVKTISEQSTERAQAVVDTSQHTVEISHAGQQSVEDTIASMAQIKERVESVAENILALSQQTRQIGEIIATVNDIATQSNMLALNASVEAARAGEHGKGFAVVAGEVRNLAEQSQKATAQVRSILLNIQNGINATVMATEEGIKVVDSGMGSVTQAQEVIERLADVINESAQTSMQMMAGGRQQASGVEQIAVAMQNINQVTVQSLASTRQAEKAAQDLNDLARSLMETVEQYQV